MTDFNYNANPLRQNPNLLGRKKKAAPQTNEFRGLARVPMKKTMALPSVMPKRKPRKVSIPGTGMKAQTNTGVTFDTSGTIKKKK